MVYKLDGGTVIDTEGNLVIENLYAGSITTITNATSGSSTSYTSGGFTGPPSTRLDTIDKFPFSSDANATDVGNLVMVREAGSGHNSATHAYAAGGSSGNNAVSKPSIDRWPFASDGNAVDYGDLEVGISNAGGGLSSETDGYVTGGSAAVPPYQNRNNIQKFPFASTNNEADVGDLTQGREDISNQNGVANGYISGGFVMPGASTHVNIIEKFPFASGGNAADVGDLSQQRGQLAGNQSLTNGYTLGGNKPGPSNVTLIEKFPFAADANATFIGDITQQRESMAGTSSVSSGYIAGGRRSSLYQNAIEKHPFSTDADTADVGDLTTPRYLVAGEQV